MNSHHLQDLNPDSPLYALATNLRERPSSLNWLGALPYPQTDSEYNLFLRRYENWLSKGYGGDMQYLHRHLELKKNPLKAFPQVKSVWIFTKSYLPRPDVQPRTDGHQSEDPHFINLLEPLRIALYARREDYHISFLKDLTQLEPIFDQQFPGFYFQAGTDALPLMEKVLAQSIGNVWMGKNTCLIHKERGSFFFVGEILSSIPLPQILKPDLRQRKEDEHINFCGKCRKCIDICPTQALQEPYVMNATRCISYWSIESQKAPPEKLRSLMGDWFFGCDLCQTVCPWNSKIIKPLTPQFSALFSLDRNLPLQNEERAQLLRSIQWIFTLSSHQIKKIFKNSPLSRKRKEGFLLNALRIIAHQNLQELLPEIKKLELSSNNPEIQEMCKWTIERLTSS